MSNWGSPINKTAFYIILAVVGAIMIAILALALLPLT